MKRLKPFMIIFLLHLALTYFVGLSSALSLGGKSSLDDNRHMDNQIPMLDTG